MPVSLDRIKCTNCHCSVLKDGDRLVCPVCGEGDTEANVIDEIGRMTGGLMGELNDIFTQARSEHTNLRRDGNGPRAN